jgi:hypothetical protein
MDLMKTVLICLVALVLLYFILNWYYGTSSQLTKMFNAQQQQRILAATIPTNNNSSNYTYSTWFYVNDWNYRFGEPKVLLARSDSDNNPGPSIVFGAMENDITVSVTCYPTGPNNGEKHLVHQCSITNFPIQKWVNLLVSLYGRTLDIYIDGKLVRTCVLPGVAKINNNADIIVTPGGGFSGMTSNFKYWSDSKNPQEAYEIYKDGAGTSSLDIFNKYKLKVSFLEDNTEKGSFSI